jgi:HSP20 family protein
LRRRVPWLTRSTLPSVWDLVSFGSQIDPIWNALEQNESTEVPKISAEAHPSAGPQNPAQTSHAPNSPSEVAVKSHKLGAIDVKQIESGTHFGIHLPGLSVGDIKLDFDFKRHALFVKAEKKVEEAKEGENGRQSFVHHVSVSRTLPLPDGVKPEDVKADFVDGVLAISITHKAIEAPADVPTSTPLPIHTPRASIAPPSTPVPASSETSADNPNGSPTIESTEASANPSLEASSSAATNDSRDEKANADDSATVEDAE